jgi:hemerythrin superfamily protein
MPNVIELLNADHREVEQLFAQFESTRDPSIARRICDELTAHSTVEEEIVYPVLARIDEDVEQEAEHEHAEAKQLIARIRSLSPHDPQLASTVSDLKAAIQHHVAEEEGVAWDKLRAGAGEQLDVLGGRVEARKEQLRGFTSPTPAPTEVRGMATTSGDFASMKKDELYELAKERKLKGRSNMTKDELIRALSA